MLRKSAGLAALALATVACHSRGTYLQNAEPMPYGPGVVDCSAYQRTENAYVHNGCWVPVPVGGVLLDVPVDPRAPRVPQPAICEPLLTDAVRVGGSTTVAPVQGSMAVSQRAVAVSGTAVPSSVALRGGSATIDVPTAPGVRVAAGRAEVEGDWRPARGVTATVPAAPAVSVQANAPRVAVSAPSVGVSAPSVGVSAPSVGVSAPSVGVTTRPGISFDGSLPTTWDEPVPPPRPGVQLPPPHVEVHSR